MQGLEAVKEMLKIQGYNGNWNYGPYMHGMFNGLELAVAAIEGREAQIREAPKVWLSEDQTEPTTALLAKFVDVLNTYEGGNALVANQGQAMDGYSTLANFKALAEEARDLLANTESTNAEGNGDSALEVLGSSGRKWEDGENRECSAFLLSSGEWILAWVSGESESRRQTEVKLSPTAVLATISAIHTVAEKTGKPVGWKPKVTHARNER